MINTDDVVKLILAISVSFAIVAISFQLMRLIGELASSIKDFRKAIQNFSKASDMVLEDYGRVRKVLQGVLDLFSGVQNMTKGLSMVSGFLGNFRNNEEEDEEEADNISE